MARNSSFTSRSVPDSSRGKSLYSRPVLESSVPIREPIVGTAAVGLQPDGETRGLVRVLRAALHDEGDLVALGRIGVVTPSLPKLSSSSCAVSLSVTVTLAEGSRPEPPTR